MEHNADNYKTLETNIQKSNNSINTILNKENLITSENISDVKKFQEHLTNKYQNTVSVVKSEIIDEFHEQNNIKYLIKYLKIDNTKNKPILINKKEFIDPFAPPLKEDMLVEEDFFNLGEHRLLFTKFPLFKEQVLLVSRDFKSQYSHLTFENFRDILILINSFNGCGFFNGGMKAGASQPRKHLQAFPYKSFPNGNNDFGIFKYIKNNENLIKLNEIKNIGEFFEIKILKNENIEHILFKFNDEFSKLIKDNKKANITGEICLILYEICAEFLNLFSYDEKGQKSEKIEKDFSFLITDEFMFICKRKEHDVFITEKDKENNDIINLNSLAFFFIIVSRSPHQIEELKEGNIVHDVLTKL